MTDTQTLRDDLAYVRSMTEQGGKAPLLGGDILLHAGVTFGTASLFQYGLADGAFAGAPPWAFNAIWGAAFIIFMAGLWTLKARVKRQPGAGTRTNVVFGTVWQALGFAIFAVFLALAAAAWRAESPLPLLAITPLVLALYGTGWWASATLTGRPWARGVSLAAFGGAVLLGALAGTAEQYLAYAAALTLTAVVPGFLLMREQAAEAG